MGLDFLEHGADFEKAISATGFGRFHFCLLAITGLIYANTAIGITIISFVLPAATCDFRMTSSDKGWLTAAPMLGMVIGSYFWGCLADTKGRKIVLVSTLLMDGFVGILSSFVQFLPVFMACRFINGFAVAGAMGICFPYLGEFQQTKYREKILCWMEMFWTLGVILLPLIAWAIIPISGIRIERGWFSYDSWNWFVAACGLPSLALGFWLLTFPESPKFMMEVGDYDDALDCLKRIYKSNTGDDPNNYPIKRLKEKPKSIVPPVVPDEGPTDIKAIKEKIKAIEEKIKHSPSTTTETSAKSIHKPPDQLPHNEPHRPPLQDPHHEPIRQPHHEAHEESHQRSHHDAHQESHHPPLESPHESPHRQTHHPPLQSPHESPHRQSHHPPLQSPHESPHRQSHQHARKRSPSASSIDSIRSIKSLKEKERTTSVASQGSVKSIRSLSMRKRKDLKRLFSEIWEQTKALCKPPYLKYTILTCLIQFGLTTSYYTLMIWFPELFNRYETYEQIFPGEHASVCTVAEYKVDDGLEEDPFDCLKTIEQSVYMHTLIVGLACIPTSLWLPLCVHKLGAKFFLIFSLGVAGLVTVGLYFVQNSTQNLVLSCIFEALTSLAISLVFCVLVDLFPTNLRVMAAALSLTAGRGGGLIGNLSFGYLIDLNCVVPIVVFSAFLFIAAILCFFLPKTGQESLD